MKIVGEVAYIENRILCNAIWGDTSCINPVPNFRGYINASADFVGRAFIEYCLARVLGIYRLPQCGYDNYTQKWYGYNTLSEAEVADACEEMKKVIKHVQHQLVSSKMAIDGKISVVRCLSEFQRDEAAKQLADDSNEEIELPVSIFSSYSYDGDISQIYPGSADSDGKHINIKENVPIEDIVLWDRYVGEGRNRCTHYKSMYDCEKELWVVDRSINGIKKMNRHNFYYTDGLPSTTARYKYHRHDFGGDFSVYGKCKMYPCEYNGLTKYIIKYNSRRLEQEK